MIYNSLIVQPSLIDAFDCMKWMTQKYNFEIRYSLLWHALKANINLVNQTSWTISAKGVYLLPLFFFVLQYLSLMVFQRLLKKFM